ncbi:hypothetical protein [Streptomyces sp. NPDC004284]|uniref:hypothetical protein n=1 Tax=Streptomyces sp. NPDC004284 TaxID=3364695 RepID=UPI00368114F9
MDADQGGAGSRDSRPANYSSGNAMNKDDVFMLRHLQQGLIVQDARYENKGLFKLIAVAMADDEFRWRLVNDTQNVLNEFQSRLDLPNGVTVRFWENTDQTLHIVLPPPAGTTSNRPAPLREFLQSRTTKEAMSGFWTDDFSDYGDPVDLQWNPDRGDHTKDG